MTETTPSIFSRIISREIPATIVAENDDLIAFEDINPQAPVHVLVVPKTAEYATVAELAAADPALLAKLVAQAQQIADERAGGQYRLIFNSGADAGQTVFHVHAHVLAGDLGEGTLVGH
ncbi:HIT domain-containing protein [Paramicrobacterium fandaimingii]|uniref:HIT domain-containing protein n=1 Tax=Paramicrobacterium fandaimingii TaxID=2708079 RepID=UPI0014220924|nr:HIT domain-containing protein [Microbacterium fandaimingii]